MPPSSSLTDEALVQALVKGDESALNDLMRRYKDKLYSFIVRYIKDEEIAYDVLQEVFIKVYLKADTFKSSYKFSTWVYRIAMNLCHDWFRKKKLTSLFSLDSLVGSSETTYHDSLEAPQENVENITLFRQQLLLVENEIEALPHKLKTALILFAVEGHSQEACATLLGVTSKTVETRVYRARKILSDKIAQKFEG